MSWALTSQAASAALDAAFKNIANLKLASDLLGVDGLSLVGERSVAGDDESIRDLRKVGRQAFRDAVDKMLVLGARAQTRERQHDH